MNIFTRHELRIIKVALISRLKFCYRMVASATNEKSRTIWTNESDKTKALLEKVMK